MILMKSRRRIASPKGIRLRPTCDAITSEFCARRNRARERPYMLAHVAERHRGRGGGWGSSNKFEGTSRVSKIRKATRELR